MFTTLMRVNSDETGRVHHFVVHMPPDYPRTAPWVSADLPEPMTVKWTSKFRDTSPSQATPQPEHQHRHPVFGRQPESKGVTLGSPEDTKASSEAVGLSLVYSQCQQYLKKFQEFFRVLEDFDQNTWVLEPDHPTLSVPTRRLALARHCSVNITITLDNPFGGTCACGWQPCKPLRNS